MDLDDVIINLKLLGMVGKHQKLVTRDVYLNIEPHSIIPESLRRWRRGDDRHGAIQKINQTVTAALKHAPENPSISMYLTAAVRGIENLKETYALCRQTCARLDATLDKIKSYAELSTHQVLPPVLPPSDPHIKVI
jgi:hypothetical protein